MVSSFGLHAIGCVTLVGRLRNAVEEKVSDRIWREEQAGVPGEGRNGNVQRALRTKIVDYAVVGDFALVFVEVLTWKEKRSVRRQLSYRSQAGNAVQTGRLATTQVRNLEDIIGCTEDRSQRARVIQDVLQIRKAVILLGAIVQRIDAAVRRFDAKRVRIEVRRNEIIERP